MMPRIEASERLTSVTNGAIAAGSMPANDAGRIMRRLEEAASGTRSKPEKGNPAAFAAMGIAVIGPSEASKEVLSDG
jgi:hypothetical protein